MPGPSPEGTTKLHEEIAQMFMVAMPATMLSVATYATISLLMVGKVQGQDHRRRAQNVSVLLQRRRQRLGGV